MVPEIITKFPELPEITQKFQTETEIPVKTHYFLRLSYTWRPSCTYFCHIHTFQKSIQNHPSMLRSLDNQLFVFWSFWTSLIWTDVAYMDSAYIADFQNFHVISLVLVITKIPVISSNFDNSGNFGIAEQFRYFRYL